MAATFATIEAGGAEGSRHRPAGRSCRGSRSSSPLTLGTTTDAAGVVTEVAIRYGVFINSIITFVIVSLVVFIITRSVIREVEAAPVKDCPFCRTDNVVDATKCRACASEI